MTREEFKERVYKKAIIDSLDHLKKVDKDITDEELEKLRKRDLETWNSEDWQEMLDKEYDRYSVENETKTLMSQDLSLMQKNDPAFYEKYKEMTATMTPDEIKWWHCIGAVAYMFNLW